MVNGRTSSHLIARIVRVLKFLLFREDDPKHRVFDVQPIHLAFLMPIPLGLCAFAVLVGWFYFGALGSLAMYLLCAVLTLEVPHCICDR